LARAGRKVLVLDPMPEVGGAAGTVEFAPGFRADLGAAGPVVLDGGIAKELADGMRGLEVLRPDPPLLALGEPGTALPLHVRPDMAAAEIARFSVKDAARWPAFCEQIHLFSEFLRAMYAAPAPEIPVRRAQAAWDLLPMGLRWLGLGARARVELLRVLPMSMDEFLAEWFESDLLRGSLAAQGVSGMAVGPRAAGTTFRFLHRLVGQPHGAAAPHTVVRGGAGVIWAGLAGLIRGHGGEVRTSAEVIQIIVRGGRAHGVALADGQEVHASSVVCSADARRVFLKWIDAGELDPGFLRAVGTIRYRGTLARMWFALDGPVQLRGKASTQSLAGGLTLAPTIDHVERTADDAKYGRISTRPWLAASLPTLTDPQRAPPGKHVLEVSVQAAPYHLAEGEWDAKRADALADAVQRELGECLEGMDRVVARGVITPRDLSETYGLAEGHPDQGEMTLDQILFQRPVPGWSNARTPIRDLYLCGAAIHPGGGIHGRPGRLAARRVLRDDRLPRSRR
jgi:phytoene dehydrogenase-like protein